MPLKFPDSYKHIVRICFHLSFLCSYKCHDCLSRAKLAVLSSLSPPVWWSAVEVHFHYFYLFIYLLLITLWKKVSLSQQSSNLKLWYWHCVLTHDVTLQYLLFSPLCLRAHLWFYSTYKNHSSLYSAVPTISGLINALHLSCPGFYSYLETLQFIDTLGISV